METWGQAGGQTWGRWALHIFIFIGLLSILNRIKLHSDNTVSKLRDFDLMQYARLHRRTTLDLRNLRLEFKRRIKADPEFLDLSRKVDGIYSSLSYAKDLAAPSIIPQKFQYAYKAIFDTQKMQLISAYTGLIQKTKQAIDFRQDELRAGRRFDTKSSLLVKAYHFSMGMGAGDLLLQNGLVRELWLSGRYVEILVLCKPVYMPSARHMYADNPAIKVIPWVEGSEAQYAELRAKGLNSTADFVKCQHANCVSDARKNCNQDFACGFYKYFDIDYSKMWSSFYSPRNFTRELDFYKLVVASVGERYNIFHEDASRGYSVDVNRVPDKTVPVYRIGKPSVSSFTEHHLFDHVYAIERAVGFHAFDSVFCFMAEIMNLNVPKYLHLYIRGAHYDQYVTNFHSSWTVVRQIAGRERPGL